jgi:hypothetical protein
MDIPQVRIKKIYKIKRWVQATEVEGLRRSSRISRKDRIRNVTIRQQIGLEGTIT